MGYKPKSGFSIYPFYIQILDREGCPIENISAYSLGMYIVPLICSFEGEDAAFLCEHIV